MNKFLHIIFIFALIFAVSCKKNSSDSNEFTIKGNFNGTNARNGIIDKVFSFFIPSAYALNPSDVRQVIVFNNSGDYKISNVSNGSFSINVDAGSPVGLVFVGEGNSYKGYLTLGNGIESLPLQTTKNNVSTIDLETLSSNGNIVEPSHNPIGYEIPLSSTEQKIIAQSNTWFSILVKNPDVDNNGQIDLLEGKYYCLMIGYYLKGGNFESSNLTPTMSNTTEILSSASYHLLFQFQKGTETTIPASVHFEYLIGSVLDSDSQSYNGDINTSVTYFSDMVNSPKPIPPSAGNCLITYNSKTLTFSIPDQSNAFDNIIIPIPTVSLNNDGTVNKINWVYKTLNGENIDNPEIFIKSISFGLAAVGSPFDINLYFSNQLTPDTNEHVLADQTIQYSSISKNIGFGYTDVYGNQFSIGYSIDNSY